MGEYRSALEFLDKWLEEGRMPPEKELRRAMKKELKNLSDDFENLRPFDGTGVVIAAVLLGDEEAYRKVVQHDREKDYYFYWKQKSGGVREEDLGRRPTDRVSAERIRGDVEWHLKERKGMPAEIRERMLAALTRLEATLPDG
ncbi:MAG: hypothetical protein ACYTAF_03295 [Planctomycetota bacterium]|jgi:hypothetical protein